MKMSMPLGRRTITTSVSGGGGGWGPLLVLGALAAVIAAVVRTANEVGADGLTAWQRANAFVESVLSTVFIVAVVLVGGYVVVRLAFEVLPDLTWPWQRREADRVRAQWAAQDQRRALREQAERVEAECVEAERVEAECVEAERLDRVTAAEEELAATEGLDGARDGRLIDAADRFRPLGVFLPDDSTTVDHEPTTVDRPLDREA